MEQVVYTVRACRWGHREDHSYIVGVYSTSDSALAAARKEEAWRGGKYECEILAFTVDQGFEGAPYEPMTVQPLRDDIL